MPACWSRSPPISSPSRRVVLGVGGGIAAYKACALLRLLTESGHTVDVLPTAAALGFVGETTWAALSGRPVRTAVQEAAHDVPHVRLGREADLVVVAPATADLLARAAHGLADDLLTNTLLTARCPVVMAPAMHTEMWLHPATRANVATLRERGVLVIDPDEGRLTGADTGPGRLPEPEAIFAVLEGLLRRETPRARDLAGVRVVVTAGGTREALDPVRYLGNRSSGRQGVALAETALARGARVTLIAAAMDVPPPAGVAVVRVESALELRDAVLDAAAGAHVVVMAAAVADFRPARVAEHKIKKADDGDDAPRVDLVRNPDILAELGAGERPRVDGQLQVVVGFAAETGDETGDVLDHGRRKLTRKGCDLLVVNDVSAGKVFGREVSAVTILGADGSWVSVEETGKRTVADRVWDAVLDRRRS
jgi:phosphopantothenoylcysteine decarboxylase/phosphopantothenate--cysteine ligase